MAMRLGRHHLGHGGQVVDRTAVVRAPSTPDEQADDTEDGQCHRRHNQSRHTTRVRRTPASTPGVLLGLTVPA